jgi:hypothetical protein
VLEHFFEILGALNPAISFIFNNILVMPLYVKTRSFVFINILRGTFISMFMGGRAPRWIFIDESVLRRTWQALQGRSTPVQALGLGLAVHPCSPIRPEVAAFLNPLAARFRSILSPIL